MNRIFVLTIFALGFIFSCKKENQTSLQIAYADVLANLHPPTINPKDSSEFYLEVDVLGEQWIYYDNIDNSFFNINVGGKFTTSSPSFNTGAISDYNDARMGAAIYFLGFDYKSYEPHIEIHMPDFNLERDPIQFLDSLLSIKDHRFMSADEVIVPEGTDFANEGLIRAGGGYLTGWKITILLPANDPNNKLFISSIMGEQKDSYLTINDVFKIEEDGNINYYLDFNFQANLYHHPQYGKSGLFSELRKGRFRGVLTVIQ